MERLTKDARLNLAIQERFKNPKSSYQKLGKIFKIPESTLRDRCNHKPTRADIIPKLRKLTPTEENTIVDRILDLDSRAFPVRLRHVEDMANLLLA